MIGRFRTSLDSLSLFNTMTKAVDMAPMSPESRDKVNRWMNANGPQLLQASASGARIATKTSARYVRDKLIKLTLGGSLGTVGGGIGGAFIGKVFGQFTIEQLMHATQTGSVSYAGGVAAGLAVGAVITGIGTATGLKIGYQFSDSLIETAANVLLEEINTGLIEEISQSDTITPS